MKKLIALLLSVAVVMSFAACGAKTETPATTAAPAAAADNGQVAESTSGLTAPVNLTLAAQEVGTGAYSVAAAVQSVMMKGLPAGSTIDLTTNSPGGVGAPVLVQNEECDLIVSNAGPEAYRGPGDRSRWPRPEDRGRRTKSQKIPLS